MFLGTHTPRLDDKGRLFLPAKFRDELSGGVVITKGQEHCLYVFTRASFSVKSEEMQSDVLTSRAVRDYSRMFFSSAFDELPDKTGRVTIPAGLRQYAGLDRDCAVIGANTRLEIWDAQTWTAYEAEREPAFADQDESGVPVPR